MAETTDLLETITSSVLQRAHTDEKTWKNSPIFVSVEIHKLLSMYLTRFLNFPIQLIKS